MQRFQAWAAIGLTTCVLTLAGCPGEIPEDGGPSEPDVVEPEGDAGVEPEDDAGPGEPEEDAGPGEPEDDAGPGEPEGDAGVEPEGDAGVEPEGDAGVEPEGDAGVEPEGDAGVEPEGDAGVEPEGDAGVEPEDGGTPVDGGPGDVVVPNPAASEAISAVLVDGTLDTVIDGAFVTDTRPAIGGDDAGFFLQAEQNGPAIFIALDPATVTIPAIEIGMDVSLIVREIADGPLGRIVTNVDSIVVNDTDLDVSPLVQDVTDVADLVSNFAAYENELVTASVTLTSGPGFAGGGFLGMDADTAGSVGEDLIVRMPEALPNELNLVPGCSFTTRARGLWNFETTVQLSIYEREDLSDWVCPFAIQAAQAPDATTVIISFDRDIDPASVTPDGSDFSISPSLDVTAASASGRAITLTTASQTEGETYTVTIGDGVRDDLGSSLNDGAVAFEGFTQLEGLASLVTNELDYNQPGTDESEFIELVNTGTTAIDLSATPLTMVFINGNGAIEIEREVFTTGILPAGGRLVIGEQPAIDVAEGDLELHRTSPDWQNGDDAVVFLDENDTVLTGIAYEGSFDDVTIGGATVSLGPVGQNAGSADGDGTSLCRIPDVVGAFTNCAPTPGALNEVAP